MMIPKQIINRLRKFENLSFMDDFREGATLQELMNAAKYYDALEGNLDREHWCQFWCTNADVWLQIEGTKMKEVYHVLNPLNGQYTTCNSVEEAKQTREQFMQEYIESRKNLFSVSQAVETENGDTLWNPIDLDKM
jgi:hypothetical protein